MRRLVFFQDNNNIITMVFLKIGAARVLKWHEGGNGRAGWLQ